MLLQISVVIGTLNQREVLEKVLLSFDEQTLPKDQFEVIVVDSSSTDSTASFLAQFKPQYKFRYTIQPNQGKAAARNRGAKEAQAPILLITDADMIAHPELLETHVKAHQFAKKATCFEGLTFNMDRLAWPVTQAQLTPYIQRDLKPFSKLGWYYFLTGNLSLPKAVFDTFEGFNELFKGYGWEDLELGYRLSKKNIPLIYLKQAVNYHYHVVSELDEMSRNVAKGQSARIFLNLHPELKWFLGLNPISRWVFPAIKPHHFIYKKAQEWFERPTHDKRRRFGAWFLKEHAYLKGVLGF